MVFEPSSLTLSVLDQSPVPEGSTPGEALRNTLDLAQLSESLGYHRYWLAEHHRTPALACASPEVLIGPVAAATRHMRVGSGGIMLPHYSPLKVAETFSMLSALYPNRIDLGVGRAAGTSPNIAVALQRDRRQAPPDDFREQLDELLGYFSRRSPAPVPFPQVSRGGHFDAPEPWMLGSSQQSAIWAAELGLPYVFADFINPTGAAAAAYYRQNFKPSSHLPAPRVGVAVWAICADTNEEAFRLSFSIRMLSTLLFRGRPIPVPSVEKAERFIRNEGVDAAMLPQGRRIVTGDPARVRSAVEEVAEEYAADEVLLVNILYDHAARRRSYELVARSFGLTGSASLADLPATS